VSRGEERSKRKGKRREVRRGVERRLKIINNENTRK
jgi:hypothetical protein